MKRPICNWCRRPAIATDTVTDRRSCAAHSRELEREENARAEQSGNRYAGESPSETIQPIEGCEAEFTAAFVGNLDAIDMPTDRDSDVSEWLADNAVHMRHGSRRITDYHFARLEEADPVLAAEVAKHLGPFRGVDRSETGYAEIDHPDFED